MKNVCHPESSIIIIANELDALERSEWNLLAHTSIRQLGVT